MRRTDLYQVRGQRVPSVTEVLELAGMTDYDQVEPGVLAKAADRGHAIAEWIELVARGHLRPDPTLAGDAELEPYLAAYLAWTEEVSFQPERVEEVVVCEALGFAGTFDATGTALLPRDGDGVLERVEVLVDWKAVAALQAQTALQTAGYALALGKPSIRRYALQLRKVGTYRFKRYDDPQDFVDYQSALGVAWWKIRNRRATLATKEAA